MNHISHWYHSFQSYKDHNQGAPKEEQVCCFVSRYILLISSVKRVLSQASSNRTQSTAINLINGMLNGVQDMLWQE